MKNCLPLPFLLLCCGLVQADVIHLKNGRTMEGKVVRQTEDTVHLRVPQGSMVLPAGMVRRIETRMTPLEEYGLKAQRTDMSDPEDVERLGLWASSRGLGEQVRHLDELAKGMRLEERVERAQGTRDAGVYVDLFRWAQAKGFSPEIPEWLFEKAQELQADHPEVRRVLEEREQLAAREEARRARTRRLERRRQKCDERDERIETLESELALERRRVTALEEAQQDGYLQNRHHRRNRNRNPYRPNYGPLIYTGTAPGGAVIVREPPKQPLRPEEQPPKQKTSIWTSRAGR